MAMISAVIPSCCFDTVGCQGLSLGLGTAPDRDRSHSPVGCPGGDRGAGTELCPPVSFDTPGYPFSSSRIQPPSFISYYFNTLSILCQRRLFIPCLSFYLRLICRIYSGLHHCTSLFLFHCPADRKYIPVPSHHFQAKLHARVFCPEMVRLNS